MEVSPLKKGINGYISIISSCLLLRRIWIQIPHAESFWIQICIEHADADMDSDQLHARTASSNRYNLDKIGSQYNDSIFCDSGGIYNLRFDKAQWNSVIS